MDEMENDDIAAAMGFSSFGGTKRKYDQTKSPKSKPDASGANTTRLGVRSKIESAAESMAEPSQDVVVPEITSHLNAATSHEVPTETKTNQKRKQKQKQPEASGLAAFLTRGQGLPEPPVRAEDDQAAAPPPQDNPEASLKVSFGGPAISKAELVALRNGVLDENGDTAIFLPSFVEDPWENPIRKRK